MTSEEDNQFDYPLPTPNWINLVFVRYRGTASECDVVGCILDSIEKKEIQLFHHSGIYC